MNNTADKTTDNIADKTTDNIADKTTDNTADKTTDNIADKTTDNIADKTTDNIADTTADNRLRPAPLIYLAGPLFSSAERAFNKTLKTLLEADGCDVFLPQEDAEDTDEERSDGGLDAIFGRCFEGLCRADIVVAVLDGVDVDSGTAWELGFAYSQKKPIIGLRTDFRICGEKEPVNLMILKSLTYYAGTTDELTAYVKKAAGLP